MADGYLEKRQQEYEERRDAYQRRKRIPARQRQIERPDDEAL